MTDRVIADAGPISASPAAEVITLGECLVALVGSETGPLAETAVFERHVAGAEANVAVGLSRLGHRVAYIGRVGGDGFGTAIVRRLRGEGVAVHHLAVDPDAPTGILVRDRRSLGAAQVLYYRRDSAGAAISVDDVEKAADAGLFGRARWLHLTGITPALSTSARSAVTRAIEQARASDLRISLDLNLRRRLWSETEAAPVLRDLAARVDVLLGSADEVAVVAGSGATDPGELAAAAIALGPSMAIVTLGPGGSVGLERGGQPIRQAALAVPAVVDPIGAGDAFAAGVIAGLLEAEPVRRALAMGAACAASILTSVGDMTGLPDRRELDELLAADRDPARDAHR
jgi:2-dehydro-3-deoxygluconokinase